MGKSKMRKILAVVMAVAVMMAFTVTGAFAASSPGKGDEPSTSKKVEKKVGDYKVYSKDGTASLDGIKKSKRAKIKKKTIFENIKSGGKKYRVTTVNSKAFKKCKKLKRLDIKWKNMKGRKFSKNAFKGLKKGQIKKIKVHVNKKMSKKDFKKLKKMLKKAGIKAKNIKRDLKV